MLFKIVNPIGDGVFTLGIEPILPNEVGKARYRVSLRTPGSKRLFGKEDDTIAVPLFYSKKRLIATALFLVTMRPGDTDADWFDNYSEDELTFAKSAECEYLAFEASLEEGENGV